MKGIVASTLVALLWVAVAAAAPQELTELAPNIDAVITGGFWEANGRRGAIRLVVVSEGFEHVVSTLYVQWLEEPGAERAAKVVRTVRVDQISGTSALSLQPLTLVGKEWRAFVAGANSHAVPVTRQRWELRFGKPGEIQVRPQRP